MIKSTPDSSESVWRRLRRPPMMLRTRNLACLATSLHTSCARQLGQQHYLGSLARELVRRTVTCSASSRLGTRMIARGRSGRDTNVESLASCSLSCCISGSTYARVLPLPVGAASNKLRPCIMAAKERAWMVVGAGRCASLAKACSSRERPSELQLLSERLSAKALTTSES